MLCVFPFPLTLLPLLDDIEVVFYEDKQETTGGMQLQPWMAKGRFGPNDVHHQVRIPGTPISSN